MKILLIYGFRLLWWLFNSWRFKKLGVFSFINNPLKIAGSKNFEIGKKVYIEKHGRIEGIKQYNKQFFNPLIQIEDGVTIQQNVHITCAKSIFIGKNTAIAANVTITDIHHPYENILIPIELQDIEVNPVLIGAQCKIYNNAVILPGIHIGKHCTIGANSVVNRNIPDYCVVAGVPARIIKRYNFESKQWERTNPDDSFIK